MKYIQFKTDNRGVQYTKRNPDGSIGTEIEEISIGIGTCPDCGQILFKNDGITGLALHKHAINQFGNEKIYCANCQNYYEIAPILDAEYEIVENNK